MHYDDGARDVLLLHALAVRLDRLDADLEVLGEEDEHLARGFSYVAMNLQFDITACKSPNIHKSLQTDTNLQVLYEVNKATKLNANPGLWGRRCAPRG